MENYDFKNQEKMRVLFAYKLKSKKFLLSNITGNVLFSVYILMYILFIFNFKKNFEKYQVLLLELFNLIMTLVFIMLYLRMMIISNTEAKKVLFFYFYYKIVYILVFPINLILFYVYCIRKYAYDPDNVFSATDITLIFIPLVIVYIIKFLQHFNYYYSIKMIE